MLKPDPGTLSPGYIGADWPVNFPGHIESLFWRKINLTLAAAELTVASLRLLAIEFWNNWRLVIHEDFQTPDQVAVWFPDGTYWATQPPPHFPPAAGTPLFGFNRATCVLIRGDVEPFPLNERRAKCYFLVQTWGSVSLVGGRRWFHRDELPGISTLMSYLDGHTYLWADKFGRKATCWPWLDVFAHPVYQRHYWGS